MLNTPIFSKKRSALTGGRFFVCQKSKFRERGGGMQVVNMKIEDLIPYENNPRKNDKAVKYVAESIKQFGFRIPIIIDKDNVVICGHTRLKSAKKLKLKEVPCVVADDLTEEQIKAFRVADNKVAEKAEWDFELLDLEIESLPDFNFEDFGFEFETEEEPEEEAPKEKKNERLRTDEAYNLKHFDEYRTEGKWQMPILAPCDKVPKRLIGFNYAMTSTDYEAGIHFYLDDYQFERVWNQPEKYIDILRKFDCVLTPTYSLYMDMSRPTKVYNSFRGKLLGQMMQDAGIDVIPLVYWAGEESYEYCFDGLPENSTLSTLTLGTSDPEVWSVYKPGLEELIKRKKPKRLLLYGNGLELDFDFGDIEILYYTNEVIERMRK